MPIRVEHGPSAQIVAQVGAMAGQEQLRQYLEQLAMKQQELDMRNAQLEQQERMAQYETAMRSQQMRYQMMQSQMEMQARREQMLSQWYRERQTGVERALIEGVKERGRMQRAGQALTYREAAAREKEQAQIRKEERELETLGKELGMKRADRLQEAVEMATNQALQREEQRQFEIKQRAEQQEQARQEIFNDVGKMDAAVTQLQLENPTISPALIRHFRNAAAQVYRLDPGSMSPDVYLRRLAKLHKDARAFFAPLPRPVDPATRVNMATHVPQPGDNLYRADRAARGLPQFVHGPDGKVIEDPESKDMWAARRVLISYEPKTWEKDKLTGKITVVPMTPDDAMAYKNRMAKAMGMEPIYVEEPAAAAPPPPPPIYPGPAAPPETGRPTPKAPPAARATGVPIPDNMTPAAQLTMDIDTVNQAYEKATSGDFEATEGLMGAVTRLAEAEAKAQTDETARELREKGGGIISADEANKLMYDHDRRRMTIGNRILQDLEQLKREYQRLHPPRGKQFGSTGGEWGRHAPVGSTGVGTR